MHTGEDSQIIQSDDRTSADEEQLHFQSDLYSLKQQFYKESMHTPKQLEQELLITEILKDDLAKIASYLELYITTADFRFPYTSVYDVFNLHNKQITPEVIEYSKNKQQLINSFMEEARDILNIYKDIPNYLKKYYINQIFRIYVFNLEYVDGEDTQ
jgi:hypothetical protein